MGSRQGRRRQHKRHKQRARARRAKLMLQLALRHVYAPAALENLRSRRALSRLIRAVPKAVGQIAEPTAVGRLAAKLQRPTFIAFGDSNLGAR